MQGFCGASVRAALMLWLLAAAVCVYAQSGGSSGAINGTVLDPTGAVVPDATVEIHNPVSHYDRSTTSDTSGNFNFPNVPFNPYHMTIAAHGFSKTAQDVEVRSVVPVSVQITLQASVGTTTVTVEAGGDLVENDSTFHNDVDRESFEKIPEESPTSEVSGLVTQSTPGVSADSNGQVHGLGDHAENSFSVDG